MVSLKILRLGELPTHFGQYILGMLFLMKLDLNLVIGAIAAFFAVFFAFNYNSTTDLKEDKLKKYVKKGVPSLTKKEVSFLKIASFVLFIAGFLLSIFIKNYLIIFYMVCSYFYSSRLTRLKTVPFIDCLMNGLGPAVLFLAAYLQSGTISNLAIFYSISLIFITGGFYLLHSIEDYKYDKIAGIKNSAQILGVKKSILFFIILLFISLLLFSFTILYNPFLGLILIFYTLVIYLGIKLFKTGKLSIIHKIRQLGRTSGYTLFLILLIQNLFVM